MQDFRKLRVWQASRELTATVYRVTATLPSVERFALTAQMRSAALSISENIAEGAGRGTKADSKRCLQIAYGSVSELLCHLIIAGDAGYLNAKLAALGDALENVRRMLAGLMARLK